MLKRVLCAICTLLLLGAALAESMLLDQWDSISHVSGSDDLYLVLKDEKWGMVNRAGEVILAPQFRYAPAFEGDYAVVAQASGFADPTGSDPSEIGSLYGVIDLQGNIILPPIYDSVYLCDDNETMLVEENNRFGFMNMDGEYFVPPEYDHARVFVGDYAAVAKRYDTDDRDSMGEITCWGMIDRSGKLCIPLDYDSLKVCENGWALASLNDHYGFVNSKNETVIDFQYWAADVFQNGYAAVAVEEKTAGTSGDDSKDIVSLWGVIDTGGREVIPCQFEYLTICENGRVLAEEDYGVYRYLTIDGEALNDQCYYRAMPYVGDLAVVGQRADANEAVSDILWGVIDAEGRQILPIQYEMVRVDSDGLIYVEQADQYASYAVEDGVAVQMET